MRELIVWNVVTLDGFFEGTKPWDLSFHELVWGPELEKLSTEQLDDLDYLLFGRRTYEGMAAYWSKETGTIADGMNNSRKLVASRKLDKADWSNSEVIGEELVTRLQALKAEDGRNIYVFGSADLVDSLFDAELVDEIRLCIAPVALGAGNPHFKRHDAARDFKLLEAKALSNGGVFLRYAPK
jgi:dihydrofolate reductase